MASFKRFLILFFLTVLVFAPLLFAGWAWVTLKYVYARGERAGFVQKISQKGWLCKTWEGELAMVNLPGAMPEIFYFSVRNQATAHRVEQLVGQRVSLTYEQHKGVPSACFGETEYFIVRISTSFPS
jgi:hypothetical protein